MTSSESPRWPSIPVAGWQDTRDTLQLYTQVVGKVRLANEPLSNHWWNSTLYVTARGLTTSLMPHPTGPAFQIDFDFLDHRLDITTVDGDRRSLPLEDRPVADFYAAVMSMLDDLGRRHRDLAGARRDPGCDPVRRRPRPRQLRPRRGAPLLAGAGRDGPGVQRVPDPLRRQGEPGALVLGRPRPRLHPLLGTDRRRRIRVVPRTAGRT